MQVTGVIMLQFSPAFSARRLVVLLALASLYGCATPDALKAEIDPLRGQVGQIEEAVKTAQSTADQARTMALENQDQSRLLAQRLDALEARLAEWHADQTTHLRAAELAAASAREQAATQGAALDQKIAQISALQAGQASQTGVLADQVEALRERLTQSELKQDEQATLTSEQAQQLTRSESAMGSAKLHSDAQDAALASRVAQAEQRVEQLAKALREGLQASRQDYFRLYGKLASTTLLTEDRTLYPINSPELGGVDRAKLDRLAEEVRQIKEDYHLDIQGHTDNIGTDDMNHALGKARAEVVKRYLHEQGGVPYSRMSVVSYGATHPLDTSTRSNRRIAINLLVLENEAGSPDLP